MSLRRARAVSLIASVILIATACVGAERPDAETWLPNWETIVAVIPNEGDLGEPPDQALCQATLAQVREQSDSLTPAPSVTVEELINEWVAIAETAFFECPPQGEDLGSFEDAYNEMTRVEESVMTALRDQG